jgi:hypothetical protein
MSGEDSETGVVNSVCELAAGRLDAWSGLQPFKPDAAPTCLGAMIRDGWLEFGGDSMSYRLFQPGTSGAEVWLFNPPGDDIRLVEVFSPAIGGATRAILRSLGNAEMQYEYPLEGRLQRMLGAPDETLEELVFAHRGLAVMLGHRPGASEWIFRLRGFERMAADVYYQRFVHLPETRFFSE